MRKLFQIFWLPWYRRWALWYIRRERSYRYAGIRLRVPAGVFHPGVFFSTPIFIDFLQQQLLSGKALDVGAGSGLLGIYAARRGCAVTAVDIYPPALEATRANAARNGVSVRTVQSDLFDALPPERFDVVLINPPYYPLKPRGGSEYAFFAGENFEYFEKLFRQLPGYVHAASRIWLILSEDCDWPRIRAEAARGGFALDSVYERRRWGERLFVAQARHSHFLHEQGADFGDAV